jgi:hypothetical protein
MGAVTQLLSFFGMAAAFAVGLKATDYLSLMVDEGYDLLMQNAFK